MPQADLLERAPTNERTKTIQSWPLGEVRERLVRKPVLPEATVDEAIAEYRKYLVLVLAGYGPLEMCSEAVDEVWHAHILFTRDYAKMSQQAFGYFLHHNPKTSTGRGLSVKDLAAREYFASAYQSVFRAAPPAIWDRLSADCGDGGSAGCGSCSD